MEESEAIVICNLQTECQDSGPLLQKYNPSQKRRQVPSYSLFKIEYTACFKPTSPAVTQKKVLFGLFLSRLNSLCRNTI